MAKQRGIVKLEGTIGDITFLKTRDGYLAKEKTQISAARIATDPAFQRTRENGAEFGRAGKAGKLLRNAFRNSIKSVADGRVVSRLLKEMMRVIKADVTSDRGLRNVLDGETELLGGFEFNDNARLAAMLFAPYTATLDRATGVASLSLASFVPATMIAAPGGATHFRMRMEAATIDFEGGTFVNGLAETALLPWDQTATSAINLTVNVGANSTHPLFLLLGIEFQQEVNGGMYPLNNGAFNALAIISVNGG